MRKGLGCRKLFGLIILGCVLAIGLIAFTLGNSKQSTASPAGVHGAIPGSDEGRIELGKTFAKPLKTAYLEIKGVKSATVGVIPTKENNHFVVSGDAVVESGTDMETAATAMRDASYRILSSIFVEFSIILYDGEKAVSYDWDNKTDKWELVEVSTPIPS